jgi:uncharacterized membrane protein YidH (DUF202 family)
VSKESDRSTLSRTTALRDLTPEESDAYDREWLRQAPNSTWYLLKKFALPVTVGGIILVKLGSMLNYVCKSTTLPTSNVLQQMSQPMVVIGGALVLLAIWNFYKKQ